MKNVLITGAGRGIGLGLTKIFSENGYRVLGTYRDEKSAQELLQLAKSSPNVIAVSADVTDEKTFDGVKEQLKKWGTLDIAINNSGVIGDRAKSALEINLNRVAEVFAVNTFGPMRVNQTVLPFMSKGGTIASISSLMGSIADNASGSHYDYRMSKTALNMYNSCLAKEFTNLTCLVLHPGWVQTDMGGTNAPVKVEDSVKGLFKVISTASLKQSGQFYDYTGKSLPW